MGWSCLPQLNILSAWRSDVASVDRAHTTYFEFESPAPLVSSEQTTTIKTIVNNHIQIPTKQNVDDGSNGKRRWKEATRWWRRRRRAAEEDAWARRNVEGQVPALPRLEPPMGRLLATLRPLQVECSHGPTWAYRPGGAACRQMPCPAPHQPAYLRPAQLESKRVVADLGRKDRARIRASTHDPGG